MDRVIIAADEIKQSSVDDLFTRLVTSDKGLSSSEAQKRLTAYGANEIREKKRSPLLKFLSFFWGPIPWMIEIAAILSAIIRHWEDFVIIMVLLGLNGIIGFWQEHKTDNALELLTLHLALKAKALRDGAWIEIAAHELVPGDIIRVRLGEVLPADVKLLAGDFLDADESALTGESLPVEKKVGDVAYSGSIVRKGEMDALVVATGMNTFFGKTAKLVEETIVSKLAGFVWGYAIVAFVVQDLLKVLIYRFLDHRGIAFRKKTKHELMLTPGMAGQQA